MIYRFGPFELDEQAGELRRAGRPVDVQPKPLALLALLVRERHRVVSQDELFDALWPGTIVTPNSLTRAVSHARRAVGDTGKGELIRRLPRRGYRFTAEVTELGAARSSAEATSPVPPAPEASPGARISAEPETQPPPAPASTRPGPRPVAQAFVGRSEALAKLDRAWAAAQGGAGGLVLLSGPAGIGKTRLAERFAAQATEGGALVVFGRSREGEGVPAFWLWSEVVRGLADAGLVPEPSHWDALLSRSAEAPDPDRRFRFFEGVARELVDASRDRPLILVLEDLQWAQSPSLRLLEHLSYELGEARLLVVGTIRSEPRTRDHPLSRVLPTLRRQPWCEPVELEGLTRGDVGRLLAEVIGRAPPAELTSEIFARTEGVPLFVREVVRLLDERGDLKHPERIRRRGVTLPEHATDLIRRSLDSLSAACREVVSAAAVLGREFGVPAAAAVADVDRGVALDHLDEAVAAGVLEEVPDAPASYRFTHALFQETAYAALPAGARARMHQRAATRIAQQGAERPADVVAELAHHHHMSLAVGDPQTAFDVALAAADEASRVTAHEQAALHFEQALDALDALEVVDPARRLSVLIEAAEAHRRAGDRERRREVARRAMESARALGRPEELARAAIRFCDVNEWSPEDREAEAAIEEALAGLDGAQTGLRAALLARSAYLGIRDPTSKEVAREAVRLGRAGAEPALLQEVIYVLHYALAGPDHIEERRALAREIIDAARASESHDTAVIALLDIACDYLTVGDRAGAAGMRARVDELVGDSPSPSILWHTKVYDAGLALMEGRLDGLDQALADALLVGRRIAHPYAQPCHNGHRMQLDRYARRYEAIRPVFARAMGSRVGPNHWARAVMVRNEVRLGAEEKARALFEELAAEDFADVQRGIRWIGTMIEIAHACADVGDAHRARVLARHLEPAAELHGVLPIPIMYSGPASFALARLNELLGIADAAGDEYAHALEAAERMGACPMQARIAKDWARLLERAGDAARAEALRKDAARLVAETGCRL